MSTRDVERELTATLHRHAEDAMNLTDTQTERERLYDVLEKEPGAKRISWLVGAAAAALAVAGTITVWASLPDDGAVPPTHPGLSTDAARAADAEALADQFMEAYAQRDRAALGTLMLVGAWGDVDSPDLDAELAHDEAWHVTYFPEPCAVTAATYVAVVVECEAALHIMGSDETGVGPFPGNVFSLVVRDGQIIDARYEYRHETNGMGDYLPVVTEWVLDQVSPADRALLDTDLGNLTETEGERWAALWRQGIDAYVAAHPSEGTSE